jgi:hypothetical protein
MRWDGPTRAHRCGSMPAVRGVHGRGRREVGGRAASADGRMAVGGFRALGVVVGKVASPEELVRVTSLC